jgi:uncharacterized RDD family membrane protein YckC
MTAAAPEVAGPSVARELVTPEGVPLELSLATMAERAAAFAIDAAIIVALLIVAGLVAYVPGAAALAGLAAFLVMNGYFVWFELKSGGRTPGKKAVGIRVVSRSGGPLRADAVFARNLTRAVEIFLPLSLVAVGEDAFPGSGKATWILAAGWMAILALVPFFNRDRLRVGDLVGGTWVVRAPRASLQRDLAKRTTYAFTPAQLEVYGIYELQALEDVLRDRNPDARRVRKAVADKIVTKIGYAAGQRLDADRFLADFYAALRAHLESRLLFGKRKEKKDR